MQILLSRLTLYWWCLFIGILHSVDLFCYCSWSDWYCDDEVIHWLTVIIHSIDMVLLYSDDIVVFICCWWYLYLLVMTWFVDPLEVTLHSPILTGDWDALLVTICSDDVMMEFYSIDTFYLMHWSGILLYLLFTHWYYSQLLFPVIPILMSDCCWSTVIPTFVPDTVTHDSVDAFYIVLFCTFPHSMIPGDTLLGIVVLEYSVVVWYVIHCILLLLLRSVEHCWLPLLFWLFCCSRLPLLEWLHSGITFWYICWVTCCSDDVLWYYILQVILLQWWEYSQWCNYRHSGKCGWWWYWRCVVLHLFCWTLFCCWLQWCIPTNSLLFLLCSEFIVIILVLWYILMELLLKLLRCCSFWWPDVTGIDLRYDLFFWWCLMFLQWWWVMVGMETMEYSVFCVVDPFHCSGDLLMMLWSDLPMEYHYRWFRLTRHSVMMVVCPTWAFHSTVTTFILDIDDETLVKWLFCSWWYHAFSVCWWRTYIVIPCILIFCSLIRWPVTIVIKLFCCDWLSDLLLLLHCYWYMLMEIVDHCYDHYVVENCYTTFHVPIWCILHLQFIHYTFPYLEAFCCWWRRWLHDVVAVEWRLMASDYYH